MFASLLERSLEINYWWKFRVFSGLRAHVLPWAFTWLSKFHSIYGAFECPNLSRQCLPSLFPKVYSDPLFVSTIIFCPGWQQVFPFSSVFYVYMWRNVTFCTSIEFKLGERDKHLISVLGQCQTSKQTQFSEKNISSPLSRMEDQCPTLGMLAAIFDTTTEPG